MLTESNNPIEQILHELGAVHQGHFVLTAGGHSPYYVNAGEIPPDAEELYRLCQYMAGHFVSANLWPEFFACPAEAAIGLNEMLALAYNQLRNPGAPKALALYASKDPDHDGRFIFRRDQDKKVTGKCGVVLDDLGTSGKSVRGVVELVQSLQGRVFEVAYLVIRGKIATADVGNVESIWAPLVLDLPNYEADTCSLCQAGVPINLELGHGRAYVAEHGQPIAQGV